MTRMIGPVAVLDPMTEEMQEKVRSIAGNLDLRFAPSASAADLAATVQGAPYIVARALGLSAETLAHADAVRFIHQWGTGTDGIDLTAAQARKVPVARSPGVNAPTVADLTLGLMLCTIRKLPQMHIATRAGDWLPGRLLSDLRDLGALRIGLIGFGAIGQEVAQRLTGFGCDTLYYRRSGAVDTSLARHASLDEILTTCDLISLHLPLSQDTRHMIGAGELARMKQGSYLVNTSRGGIIDEAAMIAALENGQLAGAGLDVFSTEPVEQSNPLLRLENVVTLPHIGGRTDDNLARMVGHWADNIRAFDQGLAIDDDCIVA
ncbi:2-hydroxyacid dehydrogenase [Neptunicoccus cionae]|uniref:2-hydroxyacid dehydrogenase n=1 Tax=Neptunicoccus cionae TaxID=2035344 RepID=UPI000C7915F8|nr:2-hydroxyacid dehydrogenase [Amylibacter cionae]PLS19855.1 3-phosphoglycerate dehydrogenase [Amylibacter cionae]